MGKSVQTPEVPDYTAAAKEQGVQNQQAALQSSTLSNPNMITPYGNQTVSYSQPTFNEAGYNTALKDYQTKTGGIDKQAFYRTDAGSGGGDAGGGGGGTYFDQAAYNAAIADAGKAPDRQAYMTGGGVPTVTQTLTPAAQQTLESQQRVQRALAGLGEVGVQNAQNVLSTPFTSSAGSLQTDFGTFDRARANTQANTYGLASSDVNADTYGLAKGEVPLQYSLDTSNLAAMPINAGTKGPRSPGWNAEANCITESSDIPDTMGAGLAHAFSGTCAIDIDDAFMATIMFAERGIDLQALLNDPNAVQIISGRPGSGKLLYRLDQPLPSKSLKIDVK